MTKHHNMKTIATIVVSLLLAHPLATRGTTVYRFSHHAFVTPPNSSNKYHHGTTFATEKTTSARIMQSPPRMYRRHTHITRLASTTAKDSSSSSNSPSNTQQQQQQQQHSYNVLYQKVIRAPASSPQTFLLDLVSYLQYVFKLPHDLPMPYEITIPNDDDDDDDDDGDDGEYNPSDNRAVLIIDSPLSNDPTEARLEVEVIGIFPDNTDVNVGPTMAMVALKKRKKDNGGSGSGSGNGVTQGLFAASEQRIVQSLDRGLQDLEEGRVSIPDSVASDDGDEKEVMNETHDDDDGVDAAMKRMGYKNAIEAASTPSSTSSDTQGSSEQTEKSPPKKQKPISIERDGLGNVIIDSVAVTSPTPTPVAAKKAKGSETKKEKKSQPKDLPAAKKSSPTATSSKTPQNQHTPRKQTSSSQAGDDSNEDDDYAIEMARRAIRQAEALMVPASVSISGGEGDFAILAAQNAAKRRELEKKYSGETMKGQERAGGETDGSVASHQVSKKKDIVREKKKAKVQDLSSDEMFMKLQKISDEAKQESWKRTIPKGSSTNSRDTRSEAEVVKTAKSATIIKGTKKNENDAIANMEKSEDEIRDDIMKIAQANEKVQQELQAATDMMNVGEEEGLSPEQLLEQVLKFGDEKEKEEKTGYGFVEGAFGKAKELLRSEDVSSNNPELGFKEGDDTKRKAEEEELKRIFAAGQSMATTRQSSSSNLVKPSITEEDIDELIDADDTVPRNARVLDDELAELEVRMSRSNGETSETPQDKVFDVFSGPEVYNPNVDPNTAVNWPGAKEGTRTDVKLATDLSTALKQAQFASAVLSEMREEVSGENDDVKYFVGAKEISLERVSLLRKCVNEAVKAGLIEDPEVRAIERSRLQMLVDELLSQPQERLEEIAMNYKDLLLSDNLVELMKERLHVMAQRDVDARRKGNEDSLKILHASERAILMNLVQIGQALVKETQALGAELEVSMLEIIRGICEVAMDPSHTSEEDTAVALTDAVRDMRPLLDDGFVAYLKYAIAEEEGKLAREGVLDDPEHNRWLFILKIVQEGVYTELSSGVKRYVDHVFYVLRMKSKTERKELLEKLIDAMPTMDVRPFVKVVNNIVSSLGTTVKGDFTDGVILGEMTNQLLQLQRDVNELLPPERINELSKDADDWAAAQRERLMERRNLTRQRLEAARTTGDIDPDEVIKKPGVEAERFD